LFNYNYITGLSRCFPRFGTVGIRREDLLIYERRSPMTPEHVGELIRQGHTVQVEPAAKRAFSDIEFEEAGAVLTTGNIFNFSSMIVCLISKIDKFQII
jgi:alanine dehydrogenase